MMYRLEDLDAHGIGGPVITGLAISILFCSASAQERTLASPPSTQSSAPAIQKTGAASMVAGGTRADGRYRIGPGDVLEIRVLKAPELSRDAVRVDQDGMIRIPMIDDDIRAACLTEGELSKAIATKYLKYKRNPHVDVFVKEYQSQMAAVIGAVNAPSQFKMHRQVKLLELLTLAGGPAERAGRVLQVVHTEGPSQCEQQQAGTGTAAAGEASQVASYKLLDTLKGDDSANPFIRGGDIVSLLDAEQVYVVGNVIRPTSIPLKDPLTVSRAIAIAGGTSPDTKKDRVRIVRQPTGGAVKQEIYVDLRAIAKHNAEDIALLPNDIVEVPSSGGKALLRSFIGTIAPTVSQLPIRVVP